MVNVFATETGDSAVLGVKAQALSKEADHIAFAKDMHIPHRACLALIGTQNHLEEITMRVQHLNKMQNFKFDHRYLLVRENSVDTWTTVDYSPSYKLSVNRTAEWNDSIATRQSSGHGVSFDDAQTDDVQLAFYFAIDKCAAHGSPYVAIFQLDQILYSAPNHPYTLPGRAILLSTKRYRKLPPRNSVKEHRCGGQLVRGKPCRSIPYVRSCGGMRTWEAALECVICNGERLQQGSLKDWHRAWSQHAPLTSVRHDLSKLRADHEHIFPSGMRDQPTAVQERRCEMHVSKSLAMSGWSDPGRMALLAESGIHMRGSWTGLMDHLIAASLNAR
eukprot:g23591.t1